VLTLDSATKQNGFRMIRRRCARGGIAAGSRPTVQSTGPPNHCLTIKFPIWVLSHRSCHRPDSNFLKIMSAFSKIEWTDSTWNPVRGCSKVSPGCAHCYAETFAERFRGVKGHPFEFGFDLRLVPEKLAEPVNWLTPRKIFVNSMSDLFHESTRTLHRTGLPRDACSKLAHLPNSHKEG
jgi:hypothetical protein